MEKSPDWYISLGWPLTVVTVAGNGLVIYLISTRKKLRTTTNWFVLSLAVADFSFGLAFFPVGAACNSNYLCTNIHKTTRIFFLYASITNLCALAVDRYSAIVKPFRHVTLMTMKRVVVLLATAWGTTLLLTPPFYFSLKLHAPEKTYFKKFSLAALSILQAFTIVALIFATSHILLIALRHARQNAALLAQLKFNHQIQHSRVFKPQEAASAKVMVIVVVFFIISMLSHLYRGFCTITELCEPNKNMVYVCELLCLANSAVNPVAYALFKKDIKVELLRLFCCGTAHRCVQNKDLA